MSPPPSQHNNKILRGLRLLDVVLTYGLDGLTELEKDTAFLKEIGLDPEVFFRQIYVERNHLETQLTDAMNSGASNIFHVGPIGVGKTTLLHFALRKYKREHEVPYILVDFKTQRFSNPENYEFVSQLDKIGYQQIEQFLRDYRPKAGKITGSRPSMIFLAELLMREENRKYLDKKNVDYSMDIDGIYNRSSERFEGVAFDQWLHNVANDFKNSQFRDVQTVLHEFLKKITLQELAYAITKYISDDCDKSRRKLVIAFDNVDHISNLTLKEQVVSWLDKSASAFSPSTIVVTNIRPQNLPGVLGADKTNKQTPFWGDGGLLYTTIRVTDDSIDDGLVKEWEHNVEGRFFDPKRDIFNEMTLTSSQKKRLAFDDKVHAKRFDFVKKMLTSGQVNNVDVSDLKIVSDAAQEVLRIKVVADDISMNSNGNRRVLLAGVINFLEYVVLDLGLEWKMIGVAPGVDGKQPGSRGSAIKSLYYKFLGVNSDIALPPVFHSGLFDPVRMVYDCGWRGNRLAGGAEVMNVAKACKDVLVMLAVHNACGNTIDYTSLEAVRISDVARKCNQFGLSRPEVFNVVEKIIRDRSASVSSFFDIDHFHEVLEGRKSINGDERIVATDRCRRTVQVTMYMFNYLCERIKESGQLKYEEDADLTKRGLVHPSLVRGFFHWLSRFVVIEMLIVEAVDASSKKGLRDALRSYHDLVMVKRTHGENPTLMTTRIIKSAQAYIEFASIQLLNDSDPSVSHVYKRALKDLMEIEKIVTKACQSVMKGEPWSVPRDQALAYV